MEPADLTVRYTLPTSHRLADKPAFDRVFAEAARSGDRYFTVLHAANSLAHPRLGMVVSRKVASRSVTRNRIRRVVRESFRTHQHEIAAKDLVVLARTEARAATNAELSDSLARHWRSASA